MKYATRYAVMLLLVVTLAGCGGSDNAPTGVGDGTGGGTSGGSGTGSSTASAPSTFARDASPGGNFLTVATFPLNSILNGCSGADCIPALTDPNLVWSDDGGTSYLRSTDTVMGVVINGDAVAFPHNIGWWHEIVNAVVGGQAICVTFCPLTGTGMVFNGDYPGGRLTMGVSGLLFNSNLIMYDRRDGQTLYPQMTGRGVVGPSMGQDLELLPMVETSWGYWKSMYPDTKVVSGNTGVYSIGQYTQYPYAAAGDYRVENNYIIYPLTVDSPASNLMGAKEMAMGVRVGDLVKAYPFKALGAQSVTNDQVGDQPVVVAYYGKERMAIPFSREVQTDAGKQVLTLDRTESTISAYPFMMKDRETGTTWNLKGQAVSGTLVGKRLTQLPSHNGFWFAWGTFWQNIGIY